MDQARNARQVRNPCDPARARDVDVVVGEVPEFEYQVSYGFCARHSMQAHLVV